MGFVAKFDLRQGKSSQSIFLDYDLAPFQLFNASHMAPYDIPTVAHDMILRFMGMNFSAVMEGSARIPSSIDGEAKPVLQNGTLQPTPTPPTGKTTEQDKAKWEGMLHITTIG